MGIVVECSGHVSSLSRVLDFVGVIAPRGGYRLTASGVSLSLIAIPASCSSLIDGCSTEVSCRHAGSVGPRLLLITSGLAYTRSPPRASRPAERTTSRVCLRTSLASMAQPLSRTQVRTSRTTKRTSVRSETPASASSCSLATTSTPCLIPYRHRQDCSGTGGSGPTGDNRPV